MNTEFLNIINMYLENENFLNSQDSIHHGTKKLDHSLRVSYYSYKIAKYLNLDYKSVAVGGLLHDFFITKTDKIEKTISIFKHHNIAYHNSINNFDLNDIEKDIIYKHMFPVVLITIPKYKESFLVSMVDKVIATAEFFWKYQKKINYSVLSKVLPIYILLLFKVKLH